MVADLRATREEFQSEDHTVTQIISRADITAPRHSALTTVSEVLRRPRISLFAFVAVLAVVLLSAWGIYHWTRGRTHQPSDAAFLSQRVREAITKPFELEWRRTSAKPWDWKLARVSNPDLEIPAGFE